MDRPRVRVPGGSEVARIDENDFDLDAIEKFKRTEIN